MCTWFYAERSTLSPIITKAQQLPLADTIRNAMSRSVEMSDNIRPTDMAAVFAPNKQGNMAVFPMIWVFTVERSLKPLINCRIETADRKPVWKDSWFRRRCVIPASWYYEWGIPPSEVGYRNANEQRNIKKEKYAIQPEGAESKAMIILITGASHTGKTLLAQKLLEKYHYPYLSIDHLKMGLIRSGQTDLTPYDDDKLTDYIWTIIKEMIKTAIENKQNMIIEGCYIPFNWKDSFDEEYLSQIKFFCLVMSEAYIDEHFSDIIGNENVIEKRLPDEDFTIQFVKQENEYYLKNCCQFGLDYILIDKSYEIEEYCQL